MAFTVQFYKAFNKRINSTDIPTSGATTISVTLKENCSEHDPVLLVKTAEFGFTYAYISTFGKYYFVRDVVFLAYQYYEYYLVEDVLATYRTDISNGIFRLMYGPSSIGNKMLIDPRVRTLNSRVEYVIGGDDANDTYRVFRDSDASPHYIVTVMNYLNSDDGGFTSSYYLDSAAMGDFKEWLMDDTIMEAISRTIVGDPLQAVVSCKFVPYSIPTRYLTHVTGITIARAGAIFSHNSNLYLINGFPVIEKEIDLVYNTRYNGISGDNAYKDFRAYPPYTYGNIFLPGVGAIDINMAEFSYVRRVVVRVSIEVITGNVRYELYNKLTSRCPVQTFTCNVASDVAIGQVSGDGKGIISGVTNSALSIGGAAISGDIGSTMSAIASTNSTILSFCKSSPSIVGSIGGRTVQLYPWITLRITTIDTEDPYSAYYEALNGTPVEGVYSLDTLSGYIKCIDASILCNANAKEKQEINDFLNGGFYLDRP